MARSHWPECHSVCFPKRNLGVRGPNGSYSGSIRCVLGAYWLFGSVWMHTERYSVAPKMCCACLIYFSSTIRMWRPCVFGKYSGTVLGAYGMYGKRTGSMRLVLGAFGMKIWGCRDPCAFRTPKMDLEHDECFQKSVLKTCGKSSDHSRLIRRVLKTFGKQSESIR